MMHHILFTVARARCGALCGYLHTVKANTDQTLDLGGKRLTVKLHLEYELT